MTTVDYQSALTGSPVWSLCFSKALDQSGDVYRATKLWVIGV